MSKITLSKFSRLAGIAIMTLVPPLAEATVVYDYVGNRFTNVAGPFYETNHQVDGFFTLPSAIAPNEVGLDITATILEFAFTDGVQEFTNLSAELDQISFLVSTDTLGSIVAWGIKLVAREPTEKNAIKSYNMLGELIVRDSGRHGPLGERSRGLAPNAPGTFSLRFLPELAQAPTTKLPEPSTLFITLLAFGLVPFSRTRQHQRLIHC